ncbi:polysaccharide biosynthesis/export family protein [Cytophaga aurantiaca]|uniref:polysaccharide biosynthesis/export family protein n=1 Tax=Cytophaga aurantiaca TaxID=29530 RepID=UPI0003A5F4C4|nr:polysaccharide biosynthesis/export family protein [Cytophaga aurantiaca]
MLSSCLNYKKTLYFQDDKAELPAPNFSQTYTLRIHDVLKIKILNPDSESKEILAKEESSMNNSGDQAYFLDYYINDSGYVDLPIIGQVKLIDYTIMQADSIITLKANDYFKYATVDVKLASFKFLALGEFQNPGQHFVSNETCTIYEAIATAGDASEYANKEKVQLIRTLENGTKKIYKINLTDYSSFTSDNYYLQPNDILYIQPQHAKVDKQNIIYVSIALSSVSLILLILSRF